MKIILIIVLNLFAQYPANIRVMTYNINAQGHGSGSYDDIANVIKDIKPDIAGLQKLDSSNSRNPIDVGKWLAEQTNYYITFAPAILNFNGSTGSYGIGFLTKLSPLSSRRLHIIHNANEEDRAALEIKVTLGGEIVRIIVTHLAHEGSTYRSNQMKEIISWIDSGGSSTIPTIIMADFNAKPTEESMKQLEKVGFVYVKGKNGEVLDTSTGQGINHILYRPEERWTVKDAGNPFYAASNRNPVWADMELLDPVSYVNKDNFEKIQKLPSVYLSNRELRFFLPQQGIVSLSLYGIDGRTITLLENSFQQGGEKKLFLGDKIISSGFYLCVINIKNKNTIVSKLFLP